MTASLDRARLLQALDDIDVALGENIARNAEIRRRVRHFRDEIGAGAAVRELIDAERRPRTVELLSENLANLEGVGSHFRLTLAQALRAEELTVHAIAELFGVTRQRISALLKQGKS